MSRVSSRSPFQKKAATGIGRGFVARQEGNHRCRVFPVMSNDCVEIPSSVQKKRAGDSPIWSASPHEQRDLYPHFMIARHKSNAFFRQRGKQRPNNSSLSVRVSGNQQAILLKIPVTPLFYRCKIVGVIDMRIRYSPDACQVFVPTLFIGGWPESAAFVKKPHAACQCS